MTAHNLVNKTQQVNAAIAADTIEDNSHSNKKVAESLLKESTNYSSDGEKKTLQAQEYLRAADALEKMAQAVRLRADELRKGKIEKDKAVDDVVQVIGNAYQMPVPKNATPELLEQIADSLEEKAKENREKADDLIKEAQASKHLAKQLEDQALMIVRKDMKLTDLDFKAAAAHNEELRMVFVKLGILQLDAQYKEQVAYSQRKAAQDSALGK